VGGGGGGGGGGEGALWRDVKKKKEMICRSRKKAGIKEGDAALSAHRKSCSKKRKSLLLSWDGLLYRNKREREGGSVLPSCPPRDSPWEKGWFLIRKGKKSTYFFARGKEEGIDSSYILEKEKSVPISSRGGETSSFLWEGRITA